MDKGDYDCAVDFYGKALAMQENLHGKDSKVCEHA